MRKFFAVAVGLVAGFAAVLSLAVPAQATVSEQARWTVVDQVVQRDVATGHLETLNVLQPANGVAYQMRAASDCINGHSCAWKDLNWTGQMLDIVWSVSCCGCKTFVASWSDVINSTRVDFGSGYGITWYTDNFCTGNSLAQHHNTDGNFANYPLGWGNTFDSYQIGVG